MDSTTGTTPITPRLSYEELAARLFQHRDKSESVSPLAMAPDDPEPRPSKCHENAAAYAAHHPGCRVVRGWLVSGGVFDAHSVVELPDGRLADPTPLSIRPPFLRHPGSDTEFALILSLSLNQVIASSVALNSSISF